MSITSELLKLKGDPEYRNLANVISRQAKNPDRMVGGLETVRKDSRMSAH